MQLIDNFLDKITMYKLVLYYLIGLVLVAIILCFFNVLPYDPYLVVFSAAFITAFSYITNKIFSSVFNAPTNVESVYISALILTLIVSPAKSLSDLPFLFWAAVLTMASKFIMAVGKKHIFNPVAVAVVLTSFGFGASASWWVGTASFVPFSLLGILIVRKIRRSDLVFYFFISALTTIFGFTALQGGNLLTTTKQILLGTPIFFFAFVMLTEPLTTPPTKKLQSLYGALVGLLYAPQFHIGTFYTTPEIALVLGNIYSYFVSPKSKIVSTIQKKIQIAPDMLDLIVHPEKQFAFIPGQYMEWTIPHKKTDARGNRRYFTIASSPTEQGIRLGVKFYSNGSSYKRAMADVTMQNPIVGAQLSGDFTLPKDPQKKLVFLAGGIGITPFRSMIKYLVDTKQKRSIILFYANKTVDEVVYYDVFNQAEKDLGIKTVYTLTDKTKVPKNWQGWMGRIDANMISREAPDYKERLFYISGPHVMVEGYQKTLRQMGIPEKQIKIDYFPGFA